MKCTQEQIKRFNERGTYLINEQYIRENWEQIYLTEVFDRYHTATTDFFREYIDELNWNWISQNEILTEKQIEEFKNYVNWDFIWCCYSHLSEEFKEKHKDRFTRIK